MTRKMSAYGRKHKAVHPLIDKARRDATFLSALRMARSYSDESVMPGDVEGFPDLMETARTAELQVRSALDGLLHCQLPEDPSLDFTRLKHALGVATIRTLQMIYGNKRRELTETIDMAALTEQQRIAVQTIYDANQALNRAYDRWQANGGYGLDGAGRQPLLDAVDLFADILVNSSPEQMRHAHYEALKVRKVAIGEAA